jgi:DNA primase
VIPPGFIQDLLARTDIVDVVGRSVELKKAGINFKGLCPFHGEKSPSFIVSPSRQTYHCFGCGAHGNAVGFLMEHSGLGFVEAVKDLAQQLGVEVPEEERSPQERERAAKAREQQVALTDLLAKASMHWRRQLKDSPKAIDYLKGRGLSGAIAAKFGLGYAAPGWHGLSSVFARYDDPQLAEAGLVIVQGDEGEQRRYDRFRDRVMFPIRNVKGEVIGFGGRVLDGGEPKYLNSPETPVFVKGRELYGLYEARQAIRERSLALVTEGYMDVVALAQLGFGNAVATLGTACTADHVHKLLRFTEHVVFSFDGDAAGRRAAARALEAVLPHATDTRRFGFLFLPAEHDPDSYVREHGAEAFQRCIDEAVPLSSQLLEHVAEGCDLGTPEGRSRMLAQARPLFDQLPDGLLREQLLQRLAERGGLGVDVLMRHWQMAQAAPRSRERTPRDDGPPDDFGGYVPDDEPAATPRRWNDRPWSPRAGQQGGRGGGNGRGQGRWHRAAGDAPRRPPPRTATQLDRTAWLLLHHPELFLTLPAEQHDALAAQPEPYAGFFGALERQLHEHGPISPQAFLEAIDQELHGDDDTSLRLLLQRLQQLHPLGEEAQPSAELSVLLDALRLEAVKVELNLLIESKDTSADATERMKALYRQIYALQHQGKGQKTSST